MPITILDSGETVSSMENTTSPDITTDEALLSRIAKGDTDAFAAFYDRHSALLFGVACRILQHEADAQDALQEACVLLWQRAALYNSGLGRPLSWAVTLVRNKAIDRFRSDHRRGAAVNRAAEDGGELSVSPAGFGLPDAEESDSNVVVRDALRTLPQEQQEALSMAFFGGLTHLELANQLGAPLGTVKARIRRGLLALRDALEGRL